MHDIVLAPITLGIIWPNAALALALLAGLVAWYFYWMVLQAIEVWKSQPKS